MEVHNIFAHDIHGEDLASQMSITIKKEQMASNQGFELKDEIVRRQSMVNIKDFIKGLKEDISVQYQEHEHSESLDQETKSMSREQLIADIMSGKEEQPSEDSKEDKETDIINEQSLKNKCKELF